MRNSLNFQGKSDGEWMGRALELARGGMGVCSPNPMVGCVVLDRLGELAGEGWHEYEVRDHAEVVALRAAGERAKGGTAFVTLEPCNHMGRTGPCSEALVRAGVSRVVAATADPNPLVAGQGFETLRRAGVAVEVGVGQDGARRLNEGFARWIVSERPLVHMKVAMTLDGKIASAAAHRIAGQPYWITSEGSRAAVQELRWQADAVLTGIGTVLADDPLLTDRSGRRRRRPLLRVVLDSGLRLPMISRLVGSADGDLLVFTLSQDAERADELRRRRIRVEVLPAKDGRLPLELVLERLGAEGILTLLTETGTMLNTALLNAGLVDRLTVFSAPRVLGSGAVAAFGEFDQPLSLEGAQMERHGSDSSFSNLERDPWEILRQHKPGLAELLAASDSSQPQSAEEREWIDAPPVGGELI